jgi:hypothetical protein
VKSSLHFVRGWSLFLALPRIRHQRKFDAIFGDTRSVWRNIGGGALFVLLAFGAASYSAMKREGVGLTALFPILVGTAVVGAIVGLLLSLKDFVAARIARDQPVNPFLWLCFGMRVWSLMIWFATALVSGFYIILGGLP